MREFAVLIPTALAMMVAGATQFLKPEPEPNPFATEQMVAVNETLDKQNVDFERLEDQLADLTRTVAQATAASEERIAELTEVVDRVTLVADGVGTLDVENSPSDGGLSNIRNLDDLVREVKRIDAEVAALKQRSEYSGGGTYSDAPSGVGNGSSGGNSAAPTVVYSTPVYSDPMPSAMSSNAVCGPDGCPPATYSRSVQRTYSSGKVPWQPLRNLFR